jgi:hypothetical protein
MCTRPSPSYRSVSASAGALGVSALNVFQALALLLLALVTAPVRFLAQRRLPRRNTALASVDVQVHLGDSACVAELESIVRKTLRRAQRTWAPRPLPLDRVVVGAGFPATGRADIYDDFADLTTTSAGDAKRGRRVVVSLGVRDGTRDLDGWEIAGALAAQIQLLIDDHCREHRSLTAPAAVVAVAQATPRLARPAPTEGHDLTRQHAIPRDQHPSQPVAAMDATPNQTAVPDEVPSLAELLATVQKGQPLVAAGPTSNGTHP